MNLLPGKVPPDILAKTVLAHLGAVDSSVILGPAIGKDAALIEVGDSLLVVSTDPITGSIEDAGWLVVHVNANDIATFGVMPRWLLISMMLPSGSTEQVLNRLTVQIHEAALSLNIAVIGGHTEITMGIDRPIITGMMIGVTQPGKFVTSAGARADDHIILTKTIGIEGTAILAIEGPEIISQKLSPSELAVARSFRRQISVVEDGVTAFETGLVTAMHDPTEGGLAGALHEMCDASGVGCEINMAALPIHPVTKKICELLSINPLELISSGCMLIACRPEGTEQVLNALQARHIQATMIGRFVKDSLTRNVIHYGKVEPLIRPNTDALWSALRL